MRYVSIDVETTGLDPLTNKIIEIGAVIDDLTSPLRSLPTFHEFVYWPKGLGPVSEWSLQNVPTWKTYWDKTVSQKGLWAKFLGSEFANWLKENGMTGKILAAGKNFASFDKRFLEETPEFSQNVRFHHRSLDPAMLFLRSSDEVPPNLSECLKRAGLFCDVKHRALDDAFDVVKLLRKGIK